MTPPLTGPLSSRARSPEPREVRRPTCVTGLPACTRLLVLCALWLLSATAPAHAQAPARAAGGQGAAQPAAAKPRIVLPFALAAQSELDAANRLAGKGSWEQAVPMLQALLDRDGGSVIWGGQAYVTVARLVNQRIAALPPGARRAYALLYDPAAEHLYQEGVEHRSAEALREAAARYLNSTCGPKAVSALASLLMDQGEFGAALLALQQADGPAAEPALAGALAAKKILCMAKLGRRVDAELVAKSLTEAGIAHLSVAGTDATPEAFLKEAFAEFAPAVAERKDWPSVGGNAAGNALPASFSLARLFPRCVDLLWLGSVQSNWPFVPSTQPVVGSHAAASSSGSDARSGGAAAPSGDAAIFIQRDGTLMSVDRRTLKANWVTSPELESSLLPQLGGRWRAEEEPLPNYLPVGNIHRWRAFDNHGLATLCLDGDHLFAVRFDPLKVRFPNQPWSAKPEDFVLTNELRCYNAASGRVVWSVGGGEDASPAALRDCWFFTAPTVSTGRAYVLAARAGALHALCLSAETGKTLWDSPIGAFESRQEAQRFAMELFTADTGPPAVADGSVIFPTGQGLVCAYNAFDGGLLWMSPYPRADAWIGRLGNSMNVPAGSWIPRQPLIAEGLCLVTPTDCRHLIALSLRTGAVAWQAEFPYGRSLLGAQDGRVYVQHMGATCLKLKTGEVVWDAPHDAAMVGIGALGRDAVYLPERDGIRKIDAATGKDQELLRWPPGIATHGNLVLVDDALIACSPERLATCATPEAALAELDEQAQADRAAYSPILLRGTHRAWSGDVAGAVADFERALALAQASGDKAAEPAAKWQAALCLAELAVTSGKGELLDRAAQLAPAEPAVQAELATARLRWVLQQPAQREAASVYLSLCRSAGMIQVPVGWCAASLWTELANIIRRDCARQPAAAEQWKTSMQALIQRAAAEHDSAALTDIAAWAPLPDARASALLQLARAAQQAGRLDEARRAFAQVIAGNPGSPAAQEAVEGLKRIFAATGAGASAPDYIALLAPSRPECELNRPPTSRAAWTVPGQLVLPSGPVTPLVQGKVLVLAGENLKCLDAASGNVVWTAQVPHESTLAPFPASVPAFWAGPGYPSCTLGAPELLVALPGHFLGIDARDGAPRWHRKFEPPAGLLPLGEAISRLALIERLRQGLPVPNQNALLRPLSGGGYASSPLAACLAYSAGGVTLFDALSGEELLTLAPAQRRQAGGMLVAAWGDRFCVARPRPPAFLVLDAAHPPYGGPGPSATTTQADATAAKADAMTAKADATAASAGAEWQLPESTVVQALMTTAGGHALLADFDGLYLFDLRQMRLLGRRLIPAGVSALVYADDSLAVLRTLDGRAVAIELAEGGRVLELSPAPGAQVVWADRAGDMLFLLECADLRQTIRYGPGSHFVGSGFALRALRMPDAAPLWRYELPGSQEQTVGTPLRCGKDWVFASGGPDQVRIAGVEALTGKESFAVELKGAGSSGPVPFTVSASRIVVGVGGTVTALVPLP